MKLRNKKTGEVKSVNHSHILVHFNDGETKCINSLAELNEEWEDYEGLKEYWSIDTYICEIDYLTEGDDDDRDNFNKEIGNYFKTKEEVEKAVEKLKAWKRLKDKGFEFTSWDRHPDFPGDFRITASDEFPCDDKDLDLLFGGEE